MQREYLCGHFRWIANKWCPDYTKTHKRCKPNVTHFEYRYTPQRLSQPPCGECKSKMEPRVPWESMIKRRGVAV
ncbi:hypothetical protein B0T14DRAFT_416283 [Immersiella caudata]|uniref:Uncharacterized protein n=1 Tax=Immersiella caudata TaxID=314043 RepID=A0AA39XHF3_9PEZI|nr:hypothetical protein B0T14DRAFT_416283 [Immersiella caudata]